MKKESVIMKINTSQLGNTVLATVMMQTSAESTQREEPGVDGTTSKSGALEKVTKGRPSQNKEGGSRQKQLYKLVTVKFTTCCHFGGVWRRL